MLPDGEHWLSLFTLRVNGTMVTNVWAEIGLVLGAYLYGSIPFVWAIAKLRGINLREHGSRSISGSNLWQATGALEGIVAALGDVSKGVVPVLIGRILGFDLVVICIAGLAAVAGQCWPVFLKFFGGRGGASSFGLAVMLVPRELLIAATPFILTGLWRNVPLFLTSRGFKIGERLRFRRAPSDIVPLSMLFCFAILPLITWLSGRPEVISLAFAGAFCLLVARRLTADVCRDFNEAPNKRVLMAVLVNRLLYDRSYRSGYR